jgi:diguanylate cyclase (GGDEF)-like protein/PAS domain S-box-containing protein
MFIILIVFIVVISYLSLKLNAVNKRRLASEMLLHTIEHSKDFYYYAKTKPELQYVYLSRGMEQYFGNGAQLAHIKSPFEAYKDIVHPDDLRIINAKIDGTANFEEPLLIRLKTVEGEYRWFEEFATPVYKNNEYVAVHGIYRDIHEKMMLQQTIIHKVMHDQLTNVKNRTYFEDQLNVYNEHYDVACAITICDLDNLKSINDTYGHKKGDEYIRKSAQLLEEAVGLDGEVCRIGGDEFAIICANTTEAKMIQLVERIHHTIKAFNNSAIDMTIEMSMGSHYSPTSIGQADTLFLHADNAMYKQKEHHKASKNNECKLR